jgi:hypothetical protein
VPVEAIPVPVEVPVLVQGRGVVHVNDGQQGVELRVSVRCYGRLPVPVEGACDMGGSLCSGGYLC